LAVSIKNFIRKTIRVYFECKDKIELGLIKTMQ